MIVQSPTWEQKAATKRADTQAKIPEEWILSTEELEKASKQRNLTGPFIEQYLSPEEIIITKNGATILCERLRKGNYRSVDVVRAFCKRAAVAQQIVGVQ